MNSKLVARHSSLATHRSRPSHMISLPHRILLLICAALLLASTTLAQTILQNKSTTEQIAIAHVTVINPGAASVQPDSIVVINGDRITFVSHSLVVPLAKNTRVIDGRGQFLIPGLWDMHVHSAFGDWFPGGRDIILPLFIANGVTGVRDMGGDIPVLFPCPNPIASPPTLAPPLLTSAPILDALLPDGKLRFPTSIAVTTPQSAVAAVD